MSKMKFSDIANELKKGIYRPVYFLYGDEPYFIDKITTYIQKNVLSEAEKSFNLTLFYGRDTNGDTVITAARRFPMMAKYQVIILKEAQYMNIEELTPYVRQPLESTILVINYKNKNPDKRKKSVKELLEAIPASNGIVFESSRLYEEKIPEWIISYLKGKKYTITMDACGMLTEYLGNDLGKIANELDKLIITLPEGEEQITPEHIEHNIGMSREYNNFELNKALASKNVLKANQIINYFARNQKDNNIALTLAMLYFFFSKVLTYHFIKNKSKKNVASVLKVNPFFVSEYEQAAKNYSKKKVVNIIRMLREYDLKSKGFGNVSADAGDLLRELVYKILH